MTGFSGFGYERGLAVVGPRLLGNAGVSASSWSLRGFDPTIGYQWTVVNGMMPPDASSMAFNSKNGLLYFSRYGVAAIYSVNPWIASGLPTLTFVSSCCSGYGNMVVDPGGQYAWEIYGSTLSKISLATGAYSSISGGLPGFTYADLTVARSPGSRAGSSLYISQGTYIYRWTLPDVAPSADNFSFTVTASSSLAITLSASDPDFDSLTYSILVPPSHGTLSGTPPNVTYAPNAGYVGPDSFQFRAYDGGRNGTGTISINVVP
jgi:hypothetical protein